MIKSILVTLVLALGFQANAFIGEVSIDVNTLERDAKAQAVGPLRLPWVVGETANYSLKMAIFNGTMNMEIKSETDAGFWVHQDVDLAGQKQLMEMLFDKETGEVLEMRVNGEKQDIPDQEDAEVVEQREEEVTVPAGTYDCIYVKMRSEGKDSEAWVNPIDVPIFGLLKQVAPSQFGSIVIELLEFKDL